MKWLYAILALIYLISPWDIFPDFFIGWGWLDDLAILLLLWRFFYTQARSQQDAGREAGQSGRRDESQNGGSQFDGQSSSAQKDPYTVLGVSRDASEQEIRSAYRRLANQYHPDKVFHLGEEFKALAEKRFKEIQSAYNSLMAH